jgi:hypothetical protein
MPTDPWRKPREKKKYSSIVHGQWRRRVHPAIRRGCQLLQLRTIFIIHRVRTNLRHHRLWRTHPWQTCHPTGKLSGAIFPTCKIYLVKYLRLVLLFSREFAHYNIAADWNKVSTTLLGRPHPPSRTRHLGVHLSWILYIDSVIFINYFRPGAARLQSTMSTAWHHYMSGSAAPDNKAKCFSFKSSLSFTFVTPKYSGAALLHLYNKIHPTFWAVSLLRYRKYTRLLGEFLFFGSGYISFCSVDLFSA